MFGVAFFFEDSQQGAHSGITGGVWQRLVNFGGGGVTPGVKNIHDLAFAAAEVLIVRHANKLAPSIVMSQALNVKNLAPPLIFVSCALRFSRKTVAFPP
jgi:hypothetical protein